MYPIILCALAGLSTGLGAVFVILNGGITNEKMSFYQGFAGGVMLAVSVLDLLRESFLYYFSYLDFFRAWGYVSSLFLSGWFVGIGAELFCNTLENKAVDESKQGVYRLSVLTTLVMVLHNLPEGVLTVMTSAYNFHLGFRISCAVALHNIPEGMAISGPVLYVTGDKKKALFQSLSAGMAEFLGGIVSYLFLKNYVSHTFLNGLMPIVAGVMCQSSICCLIPSAAKLSNIKHTIYGIITGIFIMAIGIFAL